MRAKQEDVVKEREKQLAQKQSEEQRRAEEKKKLEKERQKRQIATLSFKFDDEEEEEEEEEDEAAKSSSDENSKTSFKRIKVENDESNEASCNGTIKTAQSVPSADEDSRSSIDSQTGRKRLKITKNPEVDTSFLPDRQREEEEMRLREQLRQEWQEKQERIKNEEVDITFSYWDGSGHRRSVRMKKRNTIYDFLLKCLELLKKEFHELRAVTADQLMYVKEDLIIPHHYSFYDFIVTKARGKSGPLFSFDVHDDIRLLHDATVEKDESHAGKVLLRSWYERNKHIFPASRWEPYDPTKNYSKYTISDKGKK